jgi:hypothetical protein
VNGELQSVQGAAMAYHNVLSHGIWLQEQRKIMSNLSQGIWSPNRNLNRGPSQYVTGMVVT